MQEIWKPINNYIGLYEVSNTGKIKSLARRGNWKTHIMSPRKSKDNYRRITLCKHSQTKTYLIHRLVADAFIPNPNNLPCINHIDGNKTNNNVNNLEWCTKSENMLHAFRTGLIKPEKPWHRKPVLQYTLDGIFVKRYNSILEANNTNPDIHGTSIIKCLKGTYKTAGGYLWKYDITEG